MSATVLPQLMEVSSELTAQASDLEAQLGLVQEKLKGIQTVISMFESGQTPNLNDISAVTQTKTATKKSAKTAKPASAKAEAAKKAKPAAKSKAAKAKATTKAKATRGRPAKAKTAKAKASATGSSATPKRSGRTANWQRYVQDSYSKAPLPNVIVGVLQAKPTHVFKIADVMSAVFKEDMPKNYFLKARNRVSNILSAGARDGDWYRGRNGTYSVSEKAIKAAG